MNQEQAHRILAPAVGKANLVLVAGPAGCGKMHLLKELLKGKYPKDSGALEREDHPDHTIVNGSELKVEEARTLKGGMYQRAAFLDYRYTTIRNVDKLSTATASVMLKILEEPPPGSRWFMTVTRKDHIPETILSRAFQVTLCQPTEKEIARIMEAEGKEKPITRARWSAGNLNIARGMDTQAVEEWARWWARMYSGQLKAVEAVTLMKGLEDEEFEYQTMMRVGVLLLADAMKVDPRKWEHHYIHTLQLQREEERGQSTKLRRQYWIMEAFATAKQVKREHVRVAR